MQAGPAVGLGPFVAGIELVRTHFIQARSGKNGTTILRQNWMPELSRAFHFVLRMKSTFGIFEVYRVKFSQSQYTGVKVDDPSIHVSRRVMSCHVNPDGTSSEALDEALVELICSADCRGVVAGVRRAQCGEIGAQKVGEEKSSKGCKLKVVFVGRPKGCK